MALELKESSRWWYARLRVNGQLRRFPLVEVRDGKLQRIEVLGRRPPSLMHPERGDRKFLESFHRARAAHDLLQGEQLSKRSVEELTQRVIEAKTGTRLEFVKVAAVAEAWTALPRKKAPCPKYLAASQKKLHQFADYMRQHYPNVQDLAGVRSEHVRAFLDLQEARGIAPRTWNVWLRLLKTVFAKLEPGAEANRTYLRTAVLREEDTTHRQPFTDEEIATILEAVEGDAILRGPVVTAVCTAMRKADCCLLKWANVDLPKGFVEVRTHKTDETAEIPLLPLLRAELQRIPRTKRGEYVFPEAADLYLNDPHALDRRFRLLLRQAGFVDMATVQRAANGGHQPTRPDLPQLAPKEVLRRGLKTIADADMRQGKRDRMQQIFERYMYGKGLPTIARELGVSKSTVSLHLNEIEETLSVAVLRRTDPLPLPAVIRGETQVTGKGLRSKRRSVRGWQSFRVGFITRALAGGMPEELVRRVTGHTAVDVVRKHYFKPKRDEFRREFEKAMPHLLMEGGRTREEEVKKLLAGLNAKTLKRDKKRLLALLAERETRRSI